MMFKRKVSILMIFFLSVVLLNNTTSGTNTDIMITTDSPIIADHTIVNMVRLDQIPESAINTAKDNLHIAYGHTSHGSQVTSGMSGLDEFKNDTGLYDWAESPADGVLDLDDYFVAGDLGNPDRITWCNRTREYLDNSDNADVNVVMWSWCGQVSGTEEDIDLYLAAMTELELEYPDVTFVYMTGHCNGGGEEGSVHIRNTQIINYCITNNKVLYNFYDIECYDPDGNYFGNRDVNDDCSYDQGNWATEWQEDNTDEWYDCSSAHSQPLNANMKAYAAWWLFARLAGWQGDGSIQTTDGTQTSVEGGLFDNITPLHLDTTIIACTAIYIFYTFRKQRNQ